MEKKKQRKPFRHLDQYDRDRIEALLRASHTQQEIAEVLQVDKGTISREIKKRKRKDGRYEATTAQMKANVRRSNSKYQGMKIEQYPALRETTTGELMGYRSPDEIAGRMKRDNRYLRVGANAIYQWLYSPYGQCWCRYLCTKRYRRKKQKQDPGREMIVNRKPLAMRPHAGIHAEGDTFVSPRRAQTPASGIVVVMLDTQLIAGTLVPNRKEAVMVHAMQRLTSRVPMDTLTLDNGVENKGHERFGAPAYFRDPHAPWQKPHVEAAIGLLRRWFIPKGTDLRMVAEEQFQTYLHTLNGKYRKSLGYASAYEIAAQRGIIVEISQTTLRIPSREVAFH